MRYIRIPGPRAHTRGPWFHPKVLVLLCWDVSYLSIYKWCKHEVRSDTEASVFQFSSSFFCRRVA